MLPISARVLQASRTDRIPLRNRGIPVPQEPKTIGEHLRRRRAQLRLHQSQAARRLGISTVTLSRWELDKVYPTWGHHSKIIEYLGYDIFKLTGLRDPYRNEPEGVANLLKAAGEEIGAQIRQRRLELRMTVVELARHLQVSARTLRDWENGLHRPERRSRGRVAKFIGMYHPDEVTGV
ncbi:MAG: helix-turn-helix transcriptional regulator [Verrucomicrobia bacterium]|nr:helix-turn-helix transcriptional regulator [Verrucomicrobiota bacterium]